MDILLAALPFVGLVILTAVLWYRTRPADHGVKDYMEARVDELATGLRAAFASVVEAAVSQLAAQLDTLAEAYDQLIEDGKVRGESLQTTQDAATQRLRKEWDLTGQRLGTIVARAEGAVARAESVALQVANTASAERAEVHREMLRIGQVQTAVDMLASGSTLARIESEIAKLGAQQLRPEHVPAPAMAARTEGRLADLAAGQQSLIEAVALIRQGPVQVEALIGGIERLRAGLAESAAADAQERTALVVQIGTLSKQVTDLTARVAAEEALDLAARCRENAPEAVVHEAIERHAREAGRGEAELGRQAGRRPGLRRPAARRVGDHAHPPTDRGARADDRGGGRHAGTDQRWERIAAHDLTIRGSTLLWTSRTGLTGARASCSHSSRFTRSS